MKIVAAANRLGSCVFTGAHHHLILWQMSCCGAGKGGEQGFLTSDGRFVDRREARTIAKTAGQIVKPLEHAERAGTLFSEELWSWKDWCIQRKIPV